MHVSYPRVERYAVSGIRRRDASCRSVPLVSVPGVTRCERQGGVSARVERRGFLARRRERRVLRGDALGLLAFELAILGFSRESSLLLAPGLLLSLASLLLLLGRLLRSLGGLLLRAQLLLLGLGTRTRGSGGSTRSARRRRGGGTKTIYNGKTGERARDARRAGVAADQGSGIRGRTMIRPCGLGPGRRRLGSRAAPNRCARPADAAFPNERLERRGFR